jgi:2-dehydro-3-deoxygalactonokinase
MILIDWGTTKFRAFRISEDGQAIDGRVSECGAGSLARVSFRDVLNEQIGDWIKRGESRILMAGMVGSKRGWQEVPYVELPAGEREIADGVRRVEAEGIDARIVPGLIGVDATGVPDVMRGEETEIVGCLGTNPAFDRVCLPGTHTKWARIDGDKIVLFSTFMTGDLYAAMKKNTILAQMTTNEQPDGNAFRAGVFRSQQQGGLTHQLFGIRATVLTGHMEESAVASYLSGLLIGYEVKEARIGDQAIHLIGEPALCELYKTAIALYGGTATLEPEGAALRGLIRIGELVRW